MAPRWGGLRPEPYDPDARDADNDGIVQEGTAWERPGGTQLLSDTGLAIVRGATNSQRPRGLRVVDANNQTVRYTPSYETGQIKPVGVPDTALADHGANTLAGQGRPPIGQPAPTLKDQGFPSVRDATKPPQPEPRVDSPEPTQRRSYVPAPPRTNPDEINTTIQKVVTNSPDHKPKAGSPDARLDYFLAEQGFDGLPELVDSVDKLPEGQPVYHRGVSTAEQVDDFAHGDYFVGIGNFGNGVYASDKAETASDRVGGGTQPNVVTFALRPEAKVITYTELEKLIDELKKADPGDGSWNSNGDPYQNFAYQPSNVAALLGYDAIVVERRDEQGFNVIQQGETYLVLLNRSATVVVDPRK